MANFIAVVDRDTGRRQRFLNAVRSEIAPLGSLRIGSVEADDFGAVWAANERAPISVASSESGAAVVWGDAIPGPGPKRTDATGVFTKWDPRRAKTPAAFDGFYAAVRYDRDQGLMAGADLLGLFPVYYAASAGAILVGSSPEVFRRHPCFPAKLSHQGLTGLLLTHAPFEGRALLSGVQRLSAGHVLTWCAGRDPLEILQYANPVASGVSGSFDDHIVLLDSVIEGAIDRHIPPGESLGLLLSGGTDTRQIVSYLRDRANELHALTLGDATDYEMICAKAVAQRLGISHRVKALDHSDLPADAALQAKWEQLGSGFSTVHTWGAVAPLRELPSRVVSAYMWGIRELDQLPVEFDDVLRGSKLHGIPAETLRRLLKPELFEDLIGQLENRMREVYEEGCEIDRERASRFLLTHNWRIHGGGVPWKLSFGSWPVLPALDRAVLEATFTLPDETLLHRRAQHETIRRRAPDLARLPLDRNAFDTSPILPSRAQRVRRRIEGVLEPIRRRIPRRTERRYYHRVYDINNPGWRAVRRMAEPHRERLADLVDMDVLRELVPAPDAKIEVEHKIRDSYGIKQLLGLMLWSADHPLS